MATSMASLNIKSTVKLNNNVQMPVLGLGVYRAPPGRATRDAVRHALKIGYRHIDTARIYGNETDVGRAIIDSGISREELFITTKLWNMDQGYNSTLRACENSLLRLGLDYLDLYLIHFPVSETRKESWRAMEALLGDKCRAIGVSNFTIRHLEELLGEAKIMIRWGLQHGLVEIPKSTKEERIRENSLVFDSEISAEDMRSLDSLNEDLRLNWDPTNVP